MLSKYLKLVITILVITFSISVSIAQNKSNIGVNDLKNYDGKYPYDVKLKENKSLTIRLKKLLWTKVFFYDSEMGS